MAADFSSKHAIVRHRQEDLYMSFVDMRNFLMMIPEDKKNDVKADYDTLTATVQGFTIGVKVSTRNPYHLIELVDNGAPFKFTLSLHFDSTGTPGETEFYIEVDAQLNLLMKKMMGGKIQEALDSIVDAMAR